MPAPPHSAPRRAGPRSGIAYWMQAVLREVQRVSRDPSPEAVHDLRVALRRCRSIAASFRTLDPDPAWRQMRRAGSELATELGQLRDNHVMTEWLHKLYGSSSAPAQNLLSRLKQQEQELLVHVHTILAKFDKAQWREWRRHLTVRARRLPRGGLVFQHMALQRWIDARELHSRALRNRSQTAWHQLRIGLKRLRYTVESFLPKHHERWGKELKRLQDLLGEVHDLDVLWAVIQKPEVTADPVERDHIHQIIEQARAERIAAYREAMIGEAALWQVWRNELPSGDRLARASLAVARAWAAYRDPAPQWTGQIAQLALHLLDAFARRRMDEAYIGEDARALLVAAVAMHAAGKGNHPVGRVRPGHHKAAAKRVAAMTPPLGWDAKKLRLVAFAVRYHRGALPKSEHPTVRQVPRSERRIGMFLAGVLRLAEALEGMGDETPPQIHIEHAKDRVTLLVEGYDPLGRQSPEVASATYLIETACAVPVLVRAM